jgi:hypothetical protein
MSSVSSSVQTESPAGLLALQEGEPASACGAGSTLASASAAEIKQVANMPARKLRTGSSFQPVAATKPNGGR